MNHDPKILAVMVLASLSFASVSAQEAITSTGGNASGTGGSVSYTVSQVTYTTNSGSGGTVGQGVQQPYEIYVITSIDDSRDLSLIMSVYPNPNEGLLKLKTGENVDADLRFSVFTYNGTLLLQQAVETSETEIDLGKYPAATYFLKIYKNNREIKVFKIIKNK